MSVLRNLERTIADLVEGTFGRVFRSEVRPVEVARKLAREMDGHKTVSVSRTYVPNEFVVWLSPKDHANFVDVEHELAEELGAYLLEHARRERYALVSRPVITFSTDERLSLGDFGIQARLVRHAPDAPAPEPAEHGHTMVYSTADRLRDPVEESGTARRVRRPVIVAEGVRHELDLRGGTIGRSRECDVVLADRNVSRRHAEIRVGPDGVYVVFDLGSTNGVRVNGRPVPAAGEDLRSGDHLELGTAELVFEVE
jgi:pSer/pThr/pTyr-binding forkhead associated (FHA) protein